MWPWELKPQELSTLDSELYQGSHLFAALCRFYKASFWGAGIHMGPNHPIYLQGFLANFLYFTYSPSRKDFGKDLE